MFCIGIYNCREEGIARTRKPCRTAPRESPSGRFQTPGVLIPSLGLFDRFVHKKNPLLFLRNGSFGQRGRDSNPRYPCGYTRFPGVLLQPLGHLSVWFSLNRSAKKNIKNPQSKLNRGFFPEIP